MLRVTLSVKLGKKNYLISILDREYLDLSIALVEVRVYCCYFGNPISFNNQFYEPFFCCTAHIHTEPPFRLLAWGNKEIFRPMVPGNTYPGAVCYSFAVYF